MKASGEQPVYRTAPSSPSTQDTDPKEHLWVGRLQSLSHWGGWPPNLSEWLGTPESTNITGSHASHVIWLLFLKFEKKNCWNVDREGAGIWWWNVSWQRRWSDSRGHWREDILSALAPPERHLAQARYQPKLPDIRSKHVFISLPAKLVLFPLEVQTSWRMIQSWHLPQ